MKAITLLASVLVSAFLLTGVADKLLHWELFVLALGKNPLIPTAWAGAVGGGVIGVEALVAGLLLPGSTRRWALMLASALFGFFSVVVAFLLWRAPAAQCGCSFSSGFDRPSLRHVVLNILLTFLCGYLVRTGFRTTPTINGVRPPAAPAVTPSPTTDLRSAP